MFDHVKARHDSQVFRSGPEPAPLANLRVTSPLHRFPHPVPTVGSERLNQSADGKLHHVRALHGLLKERALAERPDEIAFLEYRELRDAVLVHLSDRFAHRRCHLH